MMKISDIVYPPQRRLVGIEPNPGPTSTEISDNSAASRLYTDVIHLIFSYIHDGTLTQATEGSSADKYYSKNASYRRFISLASTSKLWFIAAQTMKFVNETESPLNSSHASINFNKQLESLTASRLRTGVTSTQFIQAYSAEIFTKLMKARFSERMSHVRSLGLTLTIEVLGSLSSSGLNLVLPPSLTHLQLTLDAYKEREQDLLFCCTENEDESKESASRVENRTYGKMVNAIEVLTASARSSCHQLKTLDLTLTSSVKWMRLFLPSCILLPFSTLASMTRLRLLTQPTQQCLDIVRKMRHLHRLDVIGCSDILEQLTRKTQGQAEVEPLSLRYYRLISPTIEQLSLLAHCPQLTDLDLICCDHPIREAQLSNFPQLKRLSLIAATEPHNHLHFKSITQSVPQLEELQLSDRSLLSSQLCEFLPLMEQLRSLTLDSYYGYCKLPRFSFLTHCPPSMTDFILLSSPPLTQSEYIMTQGAKRIRITGCMPPMRIMRTKKPTELESTGSNPTSCTPPAPRLVGIEPNPGPPSLSIAQSLYADALHSIFAFLDLNADYSFLHAACTCRQWMSAAESMRPLPLPVVVPFSRKNIARNEYGFTRTLRHSQVAILLQSRLRHHVDSLIYSKDDPCLIVEVFHQLSQLHAVMPHLKRLSCLLCINMAEIQQSGIDPTLADSLRLHSQLRRLEIEFLIQNHAREQWTNGMDENENKSEQLTCIYSEVTRYSKALVKSMCAGPAGTPMMLPCQLEHLSLLVKSWHLPASALQPWCEGINENHFTSLRTLDIPFPTLQCVDLMRTIMQLQSCPIDCDLLGRFVIGPTATIDELGNPILDQSIIESIDVSQIPRLTSFSLSYPSSTDLFFISHFRHLTSLNLSYSRRPSDVGKLLSNLSHLRYLSMSYSTGAMFDQIVQHASQLEQCELMRISFTRQQMMNFLQNMNQLASLTLRWCFLLTPSQSIDELKSKESSEHLDANFFDRLVPITLGPSRCIPLRCRIFDVEKKLIVEHSLPAPRLVGIELNPGPASSKSIAQSLYADALHSIFVFLDLNRDYSLIHAASTCRQWMSSAESMKPHYLLDRTVDPPFASSFSSSRTGTQMSGFYFTRSLNISQGKILLSSRLRHHIDSLFYTHCYGQEQPAHDEMLRHLSQLHSRMPHLRQLSFTLHLPGAIHRIVRTTIKAAINLFKTIFSDNFDTVSSVSEYDPSSVSTFRLPSQLRRLDITMMTDTDDLITEFSDKLAASLLPIDDAIQSSSSSSSASSPLTHLTIAVLSSDKSDYSRVYFTDSALLPWTKRIHHFPFLRHIDITRPTNECVDLLRTITQLESCRLETNSLNRFLFGPNERMNNNEEGRIIDHPQIDPSLVVVPHLTEFSSVYPSEIDLFPISHLQHLTSLDLTFCMYDPGSILLSKLQHLRRFSFSTLPSQSNEQCQNVLNSIVLYAPQLQQILLQRMNFTSKQLNQFIDKMIQLEVFILKSCFQFLINIIHPSESDATFESNSNDRIPLPWEMFDEINLTMREKPIEVQIMNKNNSCIIFDYTP